MTVHTKTDNVDQTSDLVAKTDRLHSGQVKQVYSHSLPGGFAALLGGIVFAGALWDTISHTRLIAWALCYLAIFVVRLFLILAFQKAAPTGKELFTWGTLHTIHYYPERPGMDSRCSVYFPCRCRVPSDFYDCFCWRYSRRSGGGLLPNQ